MGWTAWQPVVDRDGVYAPIPARASGVYAIGSEAGVRYVGLSWSGRLRRTCLRHFQKWKRDYMHPVDRLVYDPHRHAVSWLVVRGGRAAVERAERAAMIALMPTDNALLPAELVDAEEVAPF